MPSVQSIILGLIQGLTEFLPVSSSGHLVIVPWLFRWSKHALFFDVMLHFATLFAIIIYFRKDWVNIIREGFLSIWERNLKGSVERRLFWYILLASAPALIVGALIASEAENYFRNPMAVAIMVGLFGIALYLAELYGKKDKSFQDISWRIALAIGLAQMFALVPGVSRSGITISAAMALGLSRRESVRFSFLLGAPAIFAAASYSIGVFIFQHLGQGAGNVIPWHTLPAGFISSLLSSLLAIHVLLKYVRQHTFTAFVIYRLALSSVIILLYYFRA